MIAAEKDRIRKEIKLIKKEYSAEDKRTASIKIFEKIEQLDSFNGAKTILLYWSLVDEVNTHAFIEKWYKQKTILLPVVNGTNLNLKIYTGKNSLIKSTLFGIEEPIGKNFTLFSDIDMAIIPGVAFDKNKHRLGRGKGYYDRFFNSYTGEKIGICFNYQLINNVPIEQHDVVMDSIVWT